MTDASFDEDILETAVSRREVLGTLAEGPHHRRELETELGLSKTTCHRIVRTLDERGLLERTDEGYGLSGTGRRLEAAVDDYYRSVRATFRLDPLIRAFEPAAVAFDVDALASARITRPDPNDPTLPLEREFELFESASSFSVIDCNQHVPTVFLERVFEIGIERGMRSEHIAPAPVIEKRLADFPDLHRSHDDVDAKLKYRVCEDPTFGLTLYDGAHVVVRAYDDETGSIELMADTDDSAAVSWAEAVVEHYRQVADPPASVDALPDWTPDAEIDF